MKSLLISRYFPPHVGGISHFMASVASALGPDRVCCLTDTPANGSGRDTIVKARVYRRPRAFSGRAQPISLVAATAEIMVRERPRAVQVAMADEGYLALWLRRWLGLPFVVYAHGNEVLAAARTSWDKPRLALQTAARVLANSRFTALAAERAGAHPDRIVVVSPGCDTDLFRPLPVEPELRQRLLGERAGDRILLTVGGLVARKGHDTVIRALPTVLRSCPDLTYLIAASDGRNYEALDGLARATGVRDRVVFALHVSDADLPRVYALADLFVMPSREHLDNCDVEGFGMVFLEANACGKAVVAGRSGGIPDAVLDGVTGLLVDPLSPDAVAAELVTLLTNHGLRAKLGEQGRLRVVNGFTWAHVGRRVHEIIEGL